MREYNVLLETLSRTEGAPPLQAALGGPPSVSTRFLIGTPLRGAHGGTSDNASVLVTCGDVGHGSPLLPSLHRRGCPPARGLALRKSQTGSWGAGVQGHRGRPGVFPLQQGGLRWRLTATLFRTEIQENVISPLDVSRVKEDVLHSKHAELKDRLRGIHQGYDRLRRVSHQGYGAEAGERGEHPTPPPWAPHSGVTAVCPTPSR